MTRPLIITFRIERINEKSFVVAEFGARQVRKEFPTAERFIRLAAMLDEDGQIVDVEIVTIKEP